MLSNGDVSMPDDVVLNKVEIIERCLLRLEDLYRAHPDGFREDQTLQDATLLNLERLCQATIDLGMRLVRLKALGVPKQSREAFVLLEEAGLLETRLSKSLQKMVGFRNIAIHDYRDLDLEIVENILNNDLNLFRTFSAWALTLA